MNKYLFYDTSALLLDNKISLKQKLTISSITLNELESIKNSNSKDNETKIAARALTKYIANHPDNFEVIQYRQSMLDPIREKDLEINSDMKILGCAIEYDKNYHPDETIFVTADLGQYLTANLFFGKDSVEFLQFKDEEEYEGYITVQLNE